MIEASCLRDADADCLVVETDELAFRVALNELFYEQRNGRHVKRDLDLIVSDQEAAAAATAFDDALIEPAVAVEGWFCRWWGRAWVGARVEWVGGVTGAADEPVPTDFGLVAAASLNRIRWNGLTVSVPPLDLQRAVSERRGLTDRVRLIDSLE